MAGVPEQGVSEAGQLGLFALVPGVDQAPPVLLEGAFGACQLIPWGSNYTFVVELTNARGERCLAVYKPRRGEAPLYDFPAGTLYLRERAAYLAARLLGWDFIPPTIIRTGPHGIGSLQLYIDADEHAHFFQFHHQHRSELQRMALFDLLANNADRKAGHCLLGKDGKVWGIDHGLTFHPQPKLRTVIWDFCGQPIPETLLRQLEEWRRDSQRVALFWTTLRDYLSDREIEAFLQRADALLEARLYPVLDQYRNVPRPIW